RTRRRGGEHPGPGGIGAADAAGGGGGRRDRGAGLDVVARRPRCGTIAADAPPRARPLRTATSGRARAYTAIAVTRPPDRADPRSHALASARVDSHGRRRTPDARDEIRAEFVVPRMAARADNRDRRGRYRPAPTREHHSPWA